MESNSTLPAEAKAAIDALAATVKGGLDKITDRVDDIEKKMNRPTGPGGRDDDRALAAERKALGVLIRTGDDTELKTLMVGSQPDGGYLVTPAQSNSFIKKLFDLSPMRRLARVETITAGDAFEEPYDFDESGATWVGENSARPATTTPQLKKLSVPVEEIYALQPVTQRLLDDSAFDVGGWIEGKIAEKFARAEGVAFVSGNGIAQPRGFMTLPVATTGDATRAWGTLQYSVSGSASVISDTDGGANGLVDLYWSLRSAYRANGTWLMASATANALDKLKDVNKDYIWRTGMTAGAPPSLLGRPVDFDENMPEIGAGNFPVAFGDFKRAYLIVDKLGVRYLRDPYSSKPNVLFYAYRRVGGHVADTDAIKLLKIGTS